jgi:hypothetical protein
MKKHMKLFIYLFVLTIVSCENGVEMTLINKTGKTLNQVSITNGFNTNELGKINDSIKLNTFIDFKNNNSGFDGNFGLNYLINGEPKSHKFGYYSNGIPSGSIYHIEIYKDTLIINEEFD